MFDSTTLQGKNVGIYKAEHAVFFSRIAITFWGTCTTFKNDSLNVYWTPLIEALQAVKFKTLSGTICSRDLAGLPEIKLGSLFQYNLYFWSFFQSWNK